jgi:hypothetical protein
MSTGREMPRDWIAWARAPDHDAFWAYCGQLLDFIGTGEGNALELLAPVTVGFTMIAEIYSLGFGYS